MIFDNFYECMMYIAFLSVFFAIAAFASLVVVVWKTEHGLDHSFKWYLASSFALILAMLMKTQVFFSDVFARANWVQTILDLLFVTLFLVASMHMLKTIVDESRVDPKK